MKNKFILTTLSFLLTAQAGFCFPPSVKDVVIKFSYVMGGVIVSSLVIFVCLTVYNKIRNTKNIELSPEEEVLRTPKTVDEAIKFYIRKNRLK